MKKKTLDTMSSTEIVDYLRDNPLFGGVFANDQLKNPDPKKIYVLNLQNMDEPGSHWVLLHNRCYFDSYGTPPTTAIAPFVDYHNVGNFQGLNQSSCGYYTLYCADNIFFGRDPYEGLEPGKTEANERLLKKYFF